MSPAPESRLDDPQKIIADLQRERDEALARETAIAEVLQIINSSPGDLTPVFDAILEKAHTLCGATLGSLRVFEGEYARSVAQRGHSAEFEDELRQRVPFSNVPVTKSLVDGAPFVHILDIAQLDHPLAQKSVRSGVRTLLAIPLRKDKALLGAIFAGRQEVRPFSDKQIALLQNFAAQAVIAMENARLITETREALDQQTATAEVLGVINSSPGDLTPVFDAILEKAHTFCGAEHGALLIFEGEEYRVGAVHGGTRLADHWQPGRRLPLPPMEEDSPVPRLIRGEPIIHLTDVTTDRVYSVNERFRNLIDLSGSRTLLMVPLRKDGAVLGLITAFRQEARPFSDKQIALLQNFAAQAVIAMENARLLGELRERTGDLQESLEYQTATSDVLKVMSGSAFELAPVLQTVVSTAVRLCRADQATIYRLEDGEYRWAAGHSLTPDYERIERNLRIRPGTGTLVGRVALSHDTVQILDAWTDPLYEVKEDARIGGVHTMLGVPLLREGLPIGVIGLARQRIEPYTDKETELVRTFADQAVIAIENSRLITETREALDQQTATAEVLQVINSSPGDLTPVFDAMLEKAMRLCEADFGIMFAVESESARIVATRDVPAALSDFLQEQPPPIGPNTFFGRAVLGRAVLHTADIREEEQYRSGQPLTRTASDIAGVRALLMAPLLKEDAVVGVFAIFRREVRPFTDKQIALLQNFADQAVIAMENARLLGELRQRTGDLEQSLEYQTATSEVLKVISRSTFDIQPIFQTMVETAARLCDADSALISNRESEGRRVMAACAAAPEYDAVMRGRFLPVDRGTVTGRAMLEGRVVHVADIASDPEFTFTESITLGKNRTVLGVPLLREGMVVGAIGLARERVQPFTDRQIELVRTFADQAVIALENARLITETREALEQQTATSEVLGVINSSPGDLGPVFGSMLDKALHLCEAAFGFLWTWDGEQVHRLAFRGVPAELMETLREPLRPPPGSIPERIIGGELVVSEADVLEGEGPHRFPTLARLGVRSCVGIALRKDEKLLGGITIYRQEVRPFADKQIALLQNFAAQAVIAMENARLLTETREALEQQTATAEVLGVINTSPGDLVPVFDAMLERAMRLCEASFGILWTYDGEYMHASAITGVPPQFAEFLKQGPHRPAPTMQQDLLSGRAFGQIADLTKSEGYQSGETLPRAGADLGGVRTLLGVTLRKDDRVLGIFGIYRQEVRPFTDKQIALLQNFAAQAVIAMENARLITETREALEQQTATAEVLGVINSSPGDLAPVFEALLDKALALCGGNFGFIRTYDGEVFHLGAMRGVPPELTDLLKQPRRPPFTGTALEQMLSGESVVQVADIADQPGYRNTATALAMVAAGAARTMLWVALRKAGALLGFISVFRSEVRPFTDKQIALLQNFAGQAVIAMENARLLGELRQRTDEVGALNRGLEARVAEQVDELGRVGRLKRFLAPQLAELIVSQGDEKILESHRREIVVVFCDLRGYTAFTETAEPEEVLEFLRQYHGALGPLVSQYEGTLDQFSGDGIMVFFNDPVPCPDPAERAVNMAVAMREAARKLIAAWSRHGCELGFGAGIAQGFATLGQIGFSERSGYTAIGTVCNLAARLCAEAKDGQILISSRIAEAVEAVARLEDLGNLELKGLRRPVAAFNVAQSTSPAEARPNLTVVARDAEA